MDEGRPLAEIREQGSSPEGSPASGVGRARVVAVFQPHRYTRVRDHFEGFATAEIAEGETDDPVVTEPDGGADGRSEDGVAIGGGVAVIEFERPGQERAPVRAKASRHSDRLHRPPTKAKCSTAFWARCAETNM